MAKSRFNRAKVTGVVTSVPKTEKCIDDEIELFGGNAKQIARIKKTIGLNKRRVVDSDTTALDLCESATQQLLESAGLGVTEIDALVFVTQTSDYQQPCNAAVMHGRLGFARDCAALDVNLGCSGYVYGLWLAHMMVNSGGCKRVLLLAGDTISRIVNPKDRTVAPVFGDGGSATLIEYSEGAGLAQFSLETDGSGFEKLIVPAGGMRQPCSERTAKETVDAEGNQRSLENLFMDGAEIFNFSISMEPQSVKELLDYASLSTDEVDYFVFHQANRYILENIAKRLKLDTKKVPMQTVERYGNQSSASIPCALSGELSNALLKGNPKQVLLSGFGVGLSWASVILDLSGLQVCKIIEHDPVD